ncbi:hypothetical protein Cgig2_020617 [Carnegiea gigantea]|uniref:Uncharacterized protein n=1 Tax=Carnegiea gigantea TaxID=171969 RepID=A0A9Q1Q9P7_9CARY|nr:hypothetical protein Cgig2_020617 [Carnegiea gigantea]
MARNGRQKKRYNEDKETFHSATRKGMGGWFMVDGCDVVWASECPRPLHRNKLYVHKSSVSQLLQRNGFCFCKKETDSSVEIDVKTKIKSPTYSTFGRTENVAPSVSSEGHKINTFFEMSKACNMSIQDKINYLTSDRQSHTQNKVTKMEGLKSGEKDTYNPFFKFFHSQDTYP